MSHDDCRHSSEQGGSTNTPVTFLLLSALDAGVCGFVGSYDRFPASGCMLVSGKRNQLNRSQNVMLRLIRG